MPNMILDKFLYLVTDSNCMRGKDFFAVIEQAVQGGAAWVQLREKELSTREFVEKAINLKKLLKPYHVPLIINDRLDVVLASDADGIHIGQSDMPFEIVRNMLPKGKIIGLSVESKKQVLEANLWDVDYIAASPVFATPTKTNTVVEWGLDGLKWIRENSKHNLVAIGGIKIHNAYDIVSAGSDGIAVVSAILSAEDPKQTASEFVSEITK